MTDDPTTALTGSQRGVESRPSTVGVDNVVLPLNQETAKPPQRMERQPALHRHFQYFEAELAHTRNKPSIGASNNFHIPTQATLGQRQGGQDLLGSTKNGSGHHLKHRRRLLKLGCHKV